MWVLLVLVYGLCKGIREIFKKLAFRKNTVMEVLFLYVVMSFVMVLPGVKDAFSMTDWRYLWPILFKSFVIFIAWLSNFHAMEKMPISLYGVLDLSRVLFSTVFGLVLLSETMSVPGIIGLVLVSTGLLLLKADPASRKRKQTDAKEKVAAKTIVLAFVGCGFTALSGTLDKMLMRKGEITTTQLQFWYCLFLLLFYVFYMLVTKTEFAIKSVCKNYWVYLMSASLVLGDKALFLANTYPECKVTLMTLIKQISCIVIILGGKFVFKEKRIAYKLLCAAIVIAGIVVAVL